MRESIHAVVNEIAGIEEGMVEVFDRTCPVALKKLKMLRSFCPYFCNNEMVKNAEDVKRSNHGGVFRSELNETIRMSCADSITLLADAMALHSLCFDICQSSGHQLQEVVAGSLKFKVRNPPQLFPIPYCRPLAEVA